MAELKSSGIPALCSQGLFQALLELREPQQLLAQTHGQTGHAGSGSGRWGRALGPAVRNGISGIKQLLMCCVCVPILSPWAAGTCGC